MLEEDGGDMSKTVSCANKICYCTGDCVKVDDLFRRSHEICEDVKNTLDECFEKHVKESNSKKTV